MIEVILDIRESYANPEFGRQYEIYEEKGKIIVKYIQENEFECYLAIGGYKKFKKIGKSSNSSINSSANCLQVFSK